MKLLNNRILIKFFPTISIRNLCAPALLFLVLGAHAQNQYIGEIKMFAGNFPPREWAFCDGQLLSISQNTALFSLLGTTYGGNGTTNFALPDLRGRFPMHPGTGPGLTPKTQGQVGGVETVTLVPSQMPSHTHAVVMMADSTLGTSDQPKNGLPARNASATPHYGSQVNTTLSSSSVQVGPTGGSQPHENLPPYATVQFIIALQGIFPPRN